MKLLLKVQMVRLRDASFSWVFLPLRLAPRVTLLMHWRQRYKSTLHSGCAFHKTPGKTKNKKFKDYDAEYAAKRHRAESRRIYLQKTSIDIVSARLNKTRFHRKLTVGPSDGFAVEPPRDRFPPGHGSQITPPSVWSRA